MEDHKFQIHGDNIKKKLGDPTLRVDAQLYPLIQRVAEEYRKWVHLNTEADKIEGEENIALEKIRLFDEYRRFLDGNEFDVFDSRGALQSSALEEFCYYFLRPIFIEKEDSLAIGHHLVFQDLYFTSENFSSFIDMPRPNLPVNNLDFIIGKKISATLSTDTKKEETNLYIPAVAIECKTYLDRPRFIESDIMAKNIKKGFPACLYILLSEFLKLDTNSVNIHGSEIDKIYVVRRKHNVDRKIRRANAVSLAPIHPPALIDMYGAVKLHLTQDWKTFDPYNTGILKS